jgi:hypothetical protein
MWPDHTKAIKLLNDVNSSNETWKGSRISYDADPEEIVQHIYSITQVGSLIRDKNPEKGTRPVGHEEVLNILADYILEQGKEDNEKEL